MPRNGNFIRITHRSRRCGARSRSSPSRPARRQAQQPARRSPARAARSSRRSSRQWVSPRRLGATASSSSTAPIGSGGGVAAITARTVDFGASDAPLTPDQFTACNGCVQIPWALGGTAVIYNLPGVKNLLHMDRPDARQDLPGQDHEVGRPGDQEAQQGRHAAEHGDHDRPPLATARARRTTSPTTSRREPGAGSRRSAAATRVNWPVGDGEKGSSGVAAIVAVRPPARSATLDVATPSRTTSDTSR